MMSLCGPNLRFIYREVRFASRQPFLVSAASERPVIVMLRFETLSPCRTSTILLVSVVEVMKPVYFFSLSSMFPRLMIDFPSVIIVLMFGEIFCTSS